MNKREDFQKSYYDGFAKLTNVNLEDFMNYYDEAKYGGYPEEPGGSVWESEGRSIYVLTRILKPKRVLEIGNYRGVSSRHILQAVEKNGMGEVTLLDIAEGLLYDKLPNRNFTRVLEDSIKFLSNPIEFDLIVQDSDHHKEHVKKELELILQYNMLNEYYIWGHDYYTRHKPTECCVWEAWDEMKYKFAIFEPFIDSVSDCGCVIVKKT